MLLDLKNLQNFNYIIGLDEVGRGPIAGPVNACGVKFSHEDQGVLKKLVELNVTDSKKLTKKKREKILNHLNINISELSLNTVYYNNVLGAQFSYCITEHDHGEIDQMNILAASLSAMKKASDFLGIEDTKILIDGNKAFETSAEIETIVKGDSKVLAIALASIIAKVFRDEKMKAFDKLYAGYNLAKHAGYPTKEHRDAVKKLGPSPIHRKSFKGVREYI